MRARDDFERVMIAVVVALVIVAGLLFVGVVKAEHQGIDPLPPDYVTLYTDWQQRIDELSLQLLDETEVDQQEVIRGWIAAHWGLQTLIDQAELVDIGYKGDDDDG